MESGPRTSGTVARGLTVKTAFATRLPGTRYATFTYDASGRSIGSEHAGGADRVTVTYNADDTVTVTDALGASRTITFEIENAAKKLLSVSGLPCNATCGFSAAYTNNNDGSLYDRTDWRGTREIFSYTTDGRELRTRLAVYGGGNTVRTTNTTWHGVFRLPLTITTSDRRESYVYDASGNVLSKSLVDLGVTPNTTRVWTYTYDAYGRVLTEDGPRTDVVDVTTYTYYNCAAGGGCGQLHTVTNALGHVTTYGSYNGHGQPTSITDENGATTTLAYDARGRLISRQAADEQVSFAYDDTGQIARVTENDGSYIEYEYDNAHRLTRISDGQGNAIAYTLDAAGNRLSEASRDPVGALKRSHLRVFNEQGLLVQDINAGGGSSDTTTYAYDGNGNRISVSEPLPRTTGYVYDVLNRLKTINDTYGKTTKFTADVYDNITSVVDRKNLTTTYTYNALGDLLAQTSPDTGLTTNAYDSAGNLATSADARGASANYTYDALNRVTSIDYRSNGVSDQTMTFTYDTEPNGKGRLTSAGDATQSTSWSYDVLGRVASRGVTVGTLTLAVSYHYTGGRLASLTLPSGAALSYMYDSAGRVSSVTLNGSTVIVNNVTYDPFGPVTGWMWGSGTATARFFDLDGRLSEQSSAGVTFGYSYDSASRITGISNSEDGANSWSYAYDALDRLTSASAGIGTYAFTFNANHNRLTQSGTSSINFTIASNSNRLLATSGALTRTYGHDLAGNVTGYGGVTLAYNNRGRLKSSTMNGMTSNYTYDALGRRIKRNDAGTNTTVYVYDEFGHLLGEYDGWGVPIQETVWLGDTPVALLRPNGGTTDIYYVHADHLDTPRRVTQSWDGGVRWVWHSDPFGSIPPDDNPQGLGTFVYDARFPGQVYESAMGLHYNYFRDYDPQVGRYVESDPIGLSGGINTYAYVAGRPTMATDPRGLFLCDDWKWMAVDWLAGLGSRDRSYGAESDQARQLRNLPAVDGARQLYQQKNAGAKDGCCDASKLQGVSNYASRFGVPQFIQATMQSNCAWHFVGSFRIDIVPLSCSQARFTITNNSSFTSFSYGLGPSWYGGPMGNSYQTYTWDERL